MALLWRVVSQCQHLQITQSEDFWLSSEYILFFFFRLKIKPPLYKVNTFCRQQCCIVHIATLRPWVDEQPLPTPRQGQLGAGCGFSPNVPIPQQNWKEKQKIWKRQSHPPFLNLDPIHPALISSANSINSNSN